MILEFKVRNFRSIKEEVIFSMVAEASQAKDFNIIDQPLPKGETLRLLKTAVLYGPNASGKSNLFYALFDFLGYLKNPPKLDDLNFYHKPFAFEFECSDQPTFMELTFLGPDSIKFIYGIEYDAQDVLEEYLYYYPDGNKRKCFHRTQNTEISLVSKVSLGPDFGNKKMEVFSNHLLLSKFGHETPHEFFSALYIHLQKYRVINACAPSHLLSIKREVEAELVKNPVILKRLNSLLKKSDFKLEGIEITELNEADYQFPDDFPAAKRAEIFQKYKHQLHGIHKMYYHGQEKGITKLELEYESQGTRTTFLLGGILLKALEEGSTIFVDELDTSLHPDLTKALVSLFQDANSNPKNAQLIFTTHDTNLLDSNLLRKDQIWFTSKDNFGVTDLFSLQDFGGVREDTAFEKWYHAGKFGAKPDISPSITSL